jgi:NADP-dependent 3-hydroxy acid dehydrogenase YdfG
MALALGEAGAKVLISSRKTKDLESAVSILQSSGVNASFIAADCGDSKDIIRLAENSIAQLGKVDILINNAGAAWGSPAEDHPIEAWDKVRFFKIDIYIYIYIIHLLLGNELEFERLFFA